MNRAAKCPADDTLNRYLHASLAPTLEECVEAHIENCQRCDARIRQLVDNSDAQAIPTPSRLARVEADEAPNLERYGNPEFVGSGGFGTVWRVHDRRFNRHVALKAMRQRDATNASIVRRFFSEAQICSQLSHPFIVPVHDLGTLEDGRGYYVMKLVGGHRLDEHFVGPGGSDWMSRVQAFESI